MFFDGFVKIFVTLVANNVLRYKMLTIKLMNYFCDVQKREIGHFFWGLL